MKRIERDIQIAAIKYLDMIGGDAAKIFHIPNGGSRNLLEAVSLKAQGVRSGIPDLFLPVARGHFHGLWIEVKSPSGSATKAQAERMMALRTDGYMVSLCRSAEGVIDCVKNYLSIGQDGCPKAES